jgi:flagellar basal body rod protein FlgC
MTASPSAATTEKKLLSVDIMTDSLHYAKHHVNRSNMRDTLNQSTKLTITKVGSSIRTRSYAFSSTKMLGISPKLAMQSSTRGLLNKPTRRRIVSFQFHTPTEESNESTETSVGNHNGNFRSCQVLARLHSKFQSPSKSMVTPLSPSSSSVNISNENIKLEMIDRKSPDRKPRKIHLGIRPKVLHAASMRALGLNLSSCLNAELPLLPKLGRMNGDMCSTPAPSKGVSGIFSPPVLQESADIKLHVFSPTMPQKLFLPDDF